jgi:hypothetical protein
MPVPSSINDLSTTAGSNSPAGSETPGEGDNYLRSHGAFIATLRDKLNGTSDTGTVKSATFSGTMAGAASWAGLQTFAAGLKAGNAAQSDANTLDWYEEGTFTPAAVGSVSAGAGTYAEQVGTFTRIGNRVMYEIRLTWTAHTGSGNASISGLPYAPAAFTFLYGEWRDGSQYAPARVTVNAASTSTNAVQESDTFNFFANVSLVTGTAGLYFTGQYRV